jgi:hypothetical protein
MLGLVTKAIDLSGGRRAPIYYKRRFVSDSPMSQTTQGLAKTIDL